MVSLKGLFLAVYASNGIIRTVFLPIWYMLLLSPFIAVVAYYYGLGQILQDAVGDDFSWFDILPQFAISAVFLLLPTRLLSGAGSAAKSKDGGKIRYNRCHTGFREFVILGALFRVERSG